VTAPQEYLDARGKIVRETTDVLARLAIWELTNSTDLRRYERIRYLMQMALDVESRYGTRVADVDPDRHGRVGNVITRVVPDNVLARNPDYISPEELAANQRAFIGLHNLPGATMRVCRPQDMEPDALVDAGARTDEEALADATTAVREAQRLLDSAQESINAIDPAADATTMAGAIAAEAQLRTAHQALDRLPAIVADAVIERANRNPHWEGGDGPRYGAPYEAPPAGPFAAITQQMPHMRPVVAGIEAAMAHLRPDPATQLANRLCSLAAAREALAALQVGVDTSVLDRQIAKTQAELDQIEADNVPDARPDTPPQPGEIT
jgi:hypothetical protein